MLRLQSSRHRARSVFLPACDLPPVRRRRVVRAVGPGGQHIQLPRQLVHGAAEPPVSPSAARVETQLILSSHDPTVASGWPTWRQGPESCRPAKVREASGSRPGLAASPRPHAHWRVDVPTAAPGGLPAAVKNTFKSYATASTVFGRHRPARNSRYSSVSRSPSRAITFPAASRERVRQPRPACRPPSPEGQACKPAKISLKITRTSCSCGRLRLAISSYLPSALLRGGRFGSSRCAVQPALAEGNPGDEDQRTGGLVPGDGLTEYRRA